jgi:hypothetical protein
VHSNNFLAVLAVLKKTEMLCIVHPIHSSLRFVNSTDEMYFVAMREISAAPNEDDRLDAWTWFDETRTLPLLESVDFPKPSGLFR